MSLISYFWDNALVNPRSLFLQGSSYTNSVSPQTMLEMQILVPTHFKYTELETLWEGIAVSA